MRYALTQSYGYTHDIQKHIIYTYNEEIIRYLVTNIPPGDSFNLKTACNIPGMLHLAETTRRQYLSLVLKNHEAAFPDHSGILIRINQKRWKMLDHPSTEIRDISPADFKEAMGRYPGPWELDMANCPRAGTLGHLACGWCPQHRQPVIICGCCIRREE